LTTVVASFTRAEHFYRESQKQHLDSIADKVEHKKERRNYAAEASKDCSLGHVVLKAHPLKLLRPEQNSGEDWSYRSCVNNSAGSF
jgi:hypothetical protein